MRAARLYAARQVRVEEVPSPVPGPGEVLVRVRVVAICPSDCRLYAHGHAGGVKPDHPMIQGHEFAGEVAALGARVSGPPVGTRVAVEPSWHCGVCDLCREGRTNICRNVVFPSFPQRDGALAEYIACPAFSVHPLPENVSDVEGALVEPLGVAIHAVRLAALQPGEAVVVLGAGVIGTSVVQLARLGRAGQVAVVEPVPGRREWPARLGASPVVASHTDLLATRHEAHVVFECSGEDGTLDQAVHLARPGGRIVVVGITHSERGVFDMAAARRRELTVIFSRRSRDTLAEAVRLVAERQVDLKGVSFRQFSLEETAAAMEATASRPGDMLRAIVTP
ncbi:MAG: alcohol dehydrogenase catalytic domain-containing protein [Armatimonadota bacterium]|nr:alcohol dehydrogenase catalytic domain-containing protein [Armatimonadota bacterium]